jgi:hypothetical protein
MKELIILICWHQEYDEEKILAFEKNRKSFVDYNPGIEIITVMNIMSDPKEAWLSTDLSVFNWYSNTGKRAERYVIVEWDCWCDCDMRGYFSRVWDCDLVVPSIKYPERDDWVWFKTVHQLPDKARPFAVGVTPFCGILISETAMAAISQEIFKDGYRGLNSELRLGTIATMLDLDPIVNPVYNRSIGWRFVSPFDLKYKGLHHPRKKITESRYD